MELPRYPLRTDEKVVTFEFTSEGPRGHIPKLILFTPISRKGFNLAFGDKSPETGEIDDLAVSNNGDMEKILATVVGAIYDFTDDNPDIWIYATGSTKTRTRLYRMAISRHLDKAANDFEILGIMQPPPDQVSPKPDPLDNFFDGVDMEPFQKNTDYMGFLVRRKVKK